MRSRVSGSSAYRWCGESPFGAKCNYVNDTHQTLPQNGRRRTALGRCRSRATRPHQQEQGMSIGIIGAGALGSNVARLLARSGISATIANSRGPESLAGLVGELGPSIKASTAKDSASADIVLVA